MKVAIVGMAGHAYFGFEGIEAFSNAELVAFSKGGPDEVLSSSLKVDYPGVVLVDHYEGLLDRVECDVVVVSPRFDRHSEVSAYFLERGLHVFCEKPLAFDLESLERVKAAQKKGGGQLGLMVNLRYSSEYAAAREAIHSGEIGEIEHIYAQKSYKNFSKPEWQHKRSYYGGTLPWVGSHAMDLILWMNPKPEIRSIVAHQTRGFNHGNGEMESSGYACLNYAGGGQAMVSVDYLNPKGAAQHSNDRLRILGSRGSIEVADGLVTLINDSGETQLNQKEQPHLFEDFLRAVSGEGNYRQSIEEVWRLSELCIQVQDAADRSCEAL